MIDVIVAMVTPAGFEPAIFGMRTQCPGPLDEGAEAQERKFCVYIKFRSEHSDSRAKREGP
jgi:hypothetical protein